MFNLNRRFCWSFDQFRKHIIPHVPHRLRCTLDHPKTHQPIEMSLVKPAADTKVSHVGGSFSIPPLHTTETPQTIDVDHTPFLKTIRWEGGEFNIEMGW